MRSARTGGVCTGEESGVVAVRAPLRAVVGLLTSLLLAMAFLTAVTPRAQADPEPPPDSSDAAEQLAVAQREAEVLTEQWHEAQDTLDAKRGEAQRAEDAVDPARKAARRARANEERYRTQVDPIVAEAFESGRLDQLNVLITSDSPSDFLDQMTALDMFTADRLDKLNRLVALTAETARAQAEADAAAARADRAVVEAKAAYQEIGARKKQADIRIDQAEKLLARLSPAQRARRIRDEGDPGNVVLGSGKGALAMKIAMTRLRKPYAYGADGPNSFDCSGLMYWAFKKVGITLPRSSSAQALVGKPVAKSDLKPGDLVFFYTPVSHVGFYAGNGKVLNAVQTGDVVRYSDLSKMRYHSARRL
jgi:cell wall-associated NlpC family hydrolase